MKTFEYVRNCIPLIHDVGLASYLLRILEVVLVATHPLRGTLFENFVITEMIKNRWLAAKASPLYYYKDTTGVEIDVFEEDGMKTKAYEIKSSKTISSQFLKGLAYYKIQDEQNEAQHFIYAGDKEIRRNDVLCTPYGLFLNRDDP